MSEAPAIDQLFHSMVTQGASDLHLCVELVGNGCEHETAAEILL